MELSGPLTSKFRNFFFELFLFVLGLLFILIFSTYTLLFLPTFIYRFIVAKFGPLLNPQLASILPSSGSAFAQTDEKGKAEKAVTLARITFKGSFSDRALRELVDANIIRCMDEKGKLRYPQLQQYITEWGGYKFWQWEDPFSLRDHVFSTSVPVRKRADLDTLTSQYLTIPFKKNRSPWELVVVPSMDGAETHLILRLHHALADGYSLLYMFRRAFGEEGNQTRSLQPKFSSLSIWNQITLPFQLVKLFGELAFATARGSVWKQEEEKKSWTYVQATSLPIAVQDIKKIHHKYGTSFATVVYAIVSGAIHNFLKEKQKGKDASSLPTFPTGMPFPLRNHPDRLVNKFSFILTEFPTDLKNPLERLRTMHERIEGIRGSPLPAIGYLILILHGLHLNPIGRILNSIKYCPILVTYFPLGDVEWAPFGCPVTDFSCYVKFHQGDVGAVFGVSGVHGKLRFSITANDNLLKEYELKRICELMEAEVNVLLN